MWEKKKDEQKQINEKQIDEIRKEEGNIWWIRKDLIALSIETSGGIDLSLTPERNEDSYQRVREVAHFLKTQAALLPSDDRIMAVIVYKKLNRFLWETKESTSQYAEQRIKITNILTDIHKAVLLVHNKTPIIGYASKDTSDTVREEAISALSSLITVEDKNGYHQKVVDIFLDVIKNKDREKWSTVSSAILGLWPFPSQITILSELLFQPLSSREIPYNELIFAESSATALKNQAIYLPGELNEQRMKIENMLNSASQEYHEKIQLLEENMVENKKQIENIKLIYHHLQRCLEEIELTRIKEEKQKRKLKVPEEKRIKIQHPIEAFIDKESLALISLLKVREEKKEEFVEYFLKDPRHLETHLAYVQRCLEIINEVNVEENELKLWLADHPLRKEEIRSFFKRLEEELSHWLKHKLSCSSVPKKIEKGVEISKCPVCGMDVVEKKEEIMVRYKGIIYYFCCSHCKTVFEEEPEKYHQSVERIVYR